jgi:hypothetical protein
MTFEEIDAFKPFPRNSTDEVRNFSRYQIDEATKSLGHVPALVCVEVTGAGTGLTWVLIDSSSTIGLADEEAREALSAVAEAIVWDRHGGDWVIKAIAVHRSALDAIK